MTTENKPDHHPTLPRVGFIGLGLMGGALARQTFRAKYPLTLLVHREQDRVAMADLLAQGAQTAQTPAELAAQSDVVVICVTGAPQVEDIVLGDQGIHRSARPGLAVVDLSTSLPETTLRCAGALAGHGACFVDAAMTGTPSDAETGSINLLLGGDPAPLAALEPLMRCWARNLYHCGPTGSGHTVKLLHQFVVLSNAAVLTEAFSLARKTGVDTTVLGDVIASGGANSTAFQRLRPYVEEGNDRSFRFSLANALKDMRYHGAMAQAAGANRRISEAALSAYTLANEQGLGDAFVPHLLDVADRENGVASSTTQ